MKYSAAFRTSAVALISAIAVALCSCADVTSSQESSEVRSETATTAKTSISTTSATTVATTTKAVTTSVTTVATTNETTLPETKTAATELEPEPTEPVETPEPVSVAEPTAPTDFDASFLMTRCSLATVSLQDFTSMDILTRRLCMQWLGLPLQPHLTAKLTGKRLTARSSRINQKDIYNAWHQQRRIC